MDQQEPVGDLRPLEVRPPRRLSRNTQVAVLLFIAALVIAGFVLAPAAVRSLFGTPEQAPAAESPPPGDPNAFRPTEHQWATLKLQQVDQRVFQDATLTDGKIAVDDDLVTPVFSPFTGRVTRLVAKPGDDVAQGDPLFAVQATELAQGQNDLINASSTLRTSKAQLALAQTNEKRQHDLYLAQGAALKDWQQSQVDLATAQGNLAAASVALAAVRSRLRILGKSDSDIAAIESAPDLLRLDADTFVRAPISGSVTQRQVGLGQNIVSAASAGSSTPVYMIGDLSKVWLVANAREEDAPMFRRGDPVQVSVLAFPGRVFNARIAFVAGSIDPTTHRLTVRAEVDNPRGELKPEMFARFRIITGGDATAPAVLETALSYEGSTAHVWAADPAAKTLAIRPVKVGRTRDGMVEVLQGLTVGDTVVTSGAIFIDRAATGD